MTDAPELIWITLLEDHGLNHWGVWLNDAHDTIIGPFNTISDARAASQAQHEARVMACLAESGDEWIYEEETD